MALVPSRAVIKANLVELWQFAKHLAREGRLFGAQSPRLPHAQDYVFAT